MLLSGNRTLSEERVAPDGFTLCLLADNLRFGKLRLSQPYLFDATGVLNPFEVRLCLLCIRQGNISVGPRNCNCGPEFVDRLEALLGELNALNGGSGDNVLQVRLGIRLLNQGVSSLNLGLVLGVVQHDEDIADFNQIADIPPNFFDQSGRELAGNGGSIHRFQNSTDVKG